MRTKKYVRLESEFVLWHRNGYGSGETGNRKGDGEGYGDSGGWNGDSYESSRNDYGDGDGNGFPEDPGNGFGIGSGSFIIEEE